MEDNITGRGKKKKNPKFTRGSPVARIRQQRAGAEQGGTGWMHRVGTGPECPEDKLRELM